MSNIQDIQNAGEAARRRLGIDGTMGDAQDKKHPFVSHNAGDYCLACGLPRSYKKHT